MRLRNHDYLLGALLVIGAFAAALAQNPTSKPESQSEPISCTVGDTDKDGRRFVLCEGFEPSSFSVWPKEWEDYKAKGETVKLKVVDGRAVPQPVPCEERIAKRQRILCLATGGACARANEAQNRFLTPDDCRK